MILLALKHPACVSGSIGKYSILRLQDMMPIFNFYIFKKLL